MPYVVKDGNGVSQIFASTEKAGELVTHVYSQAPASIAGQGKFTAGVSGTALPFVGASVPLLKGVYIKADTDNTHPIYIGDVTTDSTAPHGYPLYASQETFLPIDDAQKVFADADAAGQELFWIGV
jgi:hypothetical protein